MQQRIFNFYAICGAFILCLGMQSMALDFSYETFQFSSSEAESSLLFVAKSKEGILYAGNQVLGRCEPLKKNKSESQNEPVALKEGILQCKNLALKVENSTITGAITANQNLKLNPKLVDSMVLQQQKITYQYPQQPKQNTKNALISTQFYCAKDSKIQQLLQLLYHEEFDCKNAKDVFLKNAQDSLRGYFNAISQEQMANQEFEQHNWDNLYYFDQDLLVFLKGNYHYAGGAHGIFSQWGVILSKKDGVINLNTLIDFNNPELKSLLWQEYQKYLKDKEDEAYVDFESFKVPDAILLDYDSFVFIYQPYEIMPYAYGIIEFRIPLAQMAKFGNFDKTPLEPLFAK